MQSLWGFKGTPKGVLSEVLGDIHELKCGFCWTGNVRRILPNSTNLKQPQTKSEVGGGNGAERSPPPGIQAQRPSPSHRTHRTHDTTDQWRDGFLWLGRK